MIRKFDKNDIEAIMQIWKNENIKAHNFIAKDYWESNYEYVKKLIPNSEIYVYTNKEKIEGFIGINNDYIEGIFINTASQNKGIGTELLNKAKKEKTKLTLSVYEKNTKAIKFYQKNGFKITKEKLDQDTNEKEYIMLWEYVKNEKRI